MNVRQILISCLFITAFVLGGCVKKESRTNPNNRETSVQEITNVAEVLSVTKRESAAPNFSWKDSTGKSVDLDSYRGHVTVINFWATWCGPCRKELPDLIALSDEFANRNVHFIGISTDRGPNVADDVRSFVKTSAIPYQIVISNEDLEDAFGNPRAIPTTFLIDAKGNISQSFLGIRSREFLKKAIEDLLQ